MCAYWYSLTGDGVHLVALDEGDATNYRESLMPALSILGCNVGLVLSAMSAEERRRQYASTLTVGSWKQFGSDYLRDNLRDSATEVVQRGLTVAVLGDACGILADRALEIIYLSGQRGDPRAAETDQIVAQLRAGTDYTLEHKNRAVHFTDVGIHVLRRAVRWTTGSMSAATLAQQVEELLLLRAGFLSSDRAVVFADITTQGYFRGYRTLAGIAKGRPRCASVIDQVYELNYTGRPGRALLGTGLLGKASEPSLTTLSFEREVDHQRSSVYSDRAQARDAVDVRETLQELVFATVQQWSTGGSDGIVRGLQRIGLAIAGRDEHSNSLDEAISGAARVLEHAIASRGDELGGSEFDRLVHDVQLTVMDQQWAEHLARVRFIQRHPNLFDVGPDVTRQQVNEIRELYHAHRHRINEHVIGYILNVER